VLFLGWRLFELRDALFAPSDLARNMPVLAFHFLGCALQLHWATLLTMGAIKTLRGDKGVKKGK
jgi:hypothetical protein